MTRHDIECAVLIAGLIVAIAAMALLHPGWH